MPLLDALHSLIKTRDELDRLRNTVDCAVNAIIASLKDNNILEIRDCNNAGEPDSDVLEQPVVAGSSSQREDGAVAYYQYEEWCALQNYDGDPAEGPA